MDLEPAKRQAPGANPMEYAVWRLLKRSTCEATDSNSRLDPGWSTPDPSKRRKVEDNDARLKAFSRLL